MKFKKFSISIAILICLLKIHTCQLFEQFNDEPSALEKNSKSLFDEPEENLKSINTIFGSENSEKKTNNNAVPSIFGSVEDELLKPIETPKIQQDNRPSGIQQNNQINKNNNANKNTKKYSGPIKNIGNQTNKKSTGENIKPNVSCKINFK